MNVNNIVDAGDDDPTPTFYMKDRERGTCKNKTLNEDNRYKWNKATLTHAQLDTTLIYAHADTEQKRKAIEQTTPSDSPLKNHLNAEKYQVTDDELLKRLYGLK